MNWSKQPSYLTGMMGSIATDTVSGTSELSDTNGFQNPRGTNLNNHDYGRAHVGGMNGTTILGKPNYINPHNTLYNNIGEIVLREQIFDIVVFINTNKKNHRICPDPFVFQVKFDGIKPKTEMICADINISPECSEEFAYCQYTKGDAQIVVPAKLINIRSVIVKALILPMHIDYKTNEDGSYSKCGQGLAKKYKYLILKIQGLETEYNYSNVDLLEKNTFIMKVDADMGVNNEFWIPLYNTVSFFESMLQNVNRIGVEIFDENGKLLCPTLDGKKHDFHAEYRKMIDGINALKKECNPKDVKEKIKKFLPKMLSLREITNCINPDLHLLFVAYKPQINTNIKFDHF
ncbi:MAG: hypothetical protein Dasosvirus5_9 [Dasosvirus sp.]|uniref:Uncharacterized protein n=1 Tax=Dasosvirus sp. TaxID=2487764 RepID=A0A3G4ZRJ3_9VIRU|nr:MAG: hypothetical protein Dasosvirus5_9 [Dasosvirus sp.]